MDKLQELVDKMNEYTQKLRSETMFTLGDLIDELEKYPRDWEVLIEPFHLVPCCFTSYRGYYYDLCLTYSTREERLGEEMLVGKLLDMCKEADGKEFTGYKGGEFLMNRKTPIWVSDYDYSTGMAIGKIEKCFDGLINICCYKPLRH